MVPLTVVVVVIEELARAAPAIEAIRREVDEVGGEVLAVTPGRPTSFTDGTLRVVGMTSQSRYEARRAAIAAAGGAVVAIGEDHASPRRGWARAVLAAHERHHDAAGVVGCLWNGTDQTRSGRANFLAFAAPWSHPMTVVPRHRPPPLSTMSVKRWALDGLADTPGALAHHLARLFLAGAMVTDPTIVVDHCQDFGIPWAMRNAFDNARSGFAVSARGLPSARRVRLAVGATMNPRTLLREARATGAPAADLAAVVPIAVASAAGAVAGSLAGAGRSDERIC